MKSFKLPYIILAAGVFILIFNIILGGSLTSKYSEINGSYKTNKVEVNVLNNSNSLENSSFSQDDMQHLQKFAFKNTTTAYVAEKKSSVSYKNSHSDAEIYGISDKYAMFHQIKLKSGSLVTPGDKNELVAVVDETCAEALFNNDNVVGMHIELFNQKFKIIGVIDSDKSILQILTENGLGSVYIPVEQMLLYDMDSKITSFEVNLSSSGTTGQNISKVTEALTSIGKSADNYKIIDYNIEKVILAQKDLLMVFILGIVSILILLLAVKDKSVYICSMIKSDLKGNYLKDVLRMRSALVIISVVEIALLVTFIYLIWVTVKFNIYIPPNFVPSELIDTTFYSELFKSLIQDKVRNVGYVPTYPEMKLNLLSIMQNISFSIELLTGFPLYFLALKLLKLKEENVFKTLLYCCILLILLVILALIILLILKMPITINVKGVILVFTFIFLTLLRYLAIKNKIYIDNKEECI
ncbi:hypothetical protein C1H57_12965 [Clostridium sp. 2-1]|uniref:ABC transporter permease n=1 Tax=Clostridium TaxID=1485 RepID=UPI000CDAEBA7|nr:MULTISPECIES: ABC transporter permease [Clostridium]MBN7573358.1 ABC transporter permease [Clostridium beijerinckii]MBN7578696.1 ABC transporter permease [Clostridium beijerinckii]MBN7583131.1 ABC transporter permease [Clostridium beijerinckii]MBO0519286.1 ABC transporter permease [Clostridium beijerinckii]POO90867.1 hypothetical protein C1H57_12965 [Clostridium sp. 2-1]